MLIFLLFAVTYGMNQEQMEQIHQQSRIQLYDNLPDSLPACNLKVLQSLVDLATEAGDERKLDILQHNILQRRAEKKKQPEKVASSENLIFYNENSAIPQPEKIQPKITRMGRVKQTVSTIKQNAFVGLKLIGPILIALILDFGADVSLFKMSGAAVSFGFNPFTAVIMWWIAVATIFLKVIFGTCRWSLAMFRMYAGMLLVVGFVPARARLPGFVNQGYSKFLMFYVFFMLLFSPTEFFYFMFSWIIFDAFFKRKSPHYSKTAIHNTSKGIQSLINLSLAPGLRLKRALNVSPEDALSKKFFFRTITVAAFIFFPLVIFAFGATIFSWCANKVIQILVNKMLNTTIKNFLLASFPQYQMIDFLFKFILKVFRSLKLV